MRNFARVLKASWTYRTKLILSAVCAACVALTWSLNLSSIYPVLKILSSGQNLQTWNDHEIALLQSQAAEKTRLEKIAALQDEINQLEKEGPLSPERQTTQDISRRKKTSELAKLQGEVEELNTWLYRYQLLKTKVLIYVPTDRFETFLCIVAMIIVSVFVKGLFEFCQESLIGMVVSRTLFDLRNRFFRSAIHQDLRQLSEAGSTEVLTRFTNDTEQIGAGLKMLYGRVVLEPLKIICCTTTALFISWQLTLMFAVIVPVALFTLIWVSKKMKRAARRMLEGMSEIYKVLREVLDGIKVVKAFHNEAHERRRFRRVTESYYKKSMRVINLDAFTGPTVEWLGVIAVTMALCVGAYLVLRQKTEIFGIRMLSQEMGFEALLALYMMLAAVAEPVRKLSSVYSKIQGGAVAADRVFALFDRQPHVQVNADGPVVPRHAKCIEFKHVCFSYVPGSETLMDVDLSVKAGETVALVGPNGCGKTTLLGLLARFYDPDFGNISVDGVNLRNGNLRSLRRQIGMVTQETVLFDESIHNNIAYGKPGATREQVIAAAERAFAHEFIETMPDGYDTQVGEMGGKLSGGQKQRIALARAILRNPAILILDEFTSQIDAESEVKIHTALRDFVKGRTTFLITHRMNTLDIADRIVVMDAGRIVATGTHEKLITSCDLYRRLYDAVQSGRFGDSPSRAAA